MLSNQKPAAFTDKNWRRINMRKVDHLIAAECLHNLYNRHWPLINSIRFRHTVTNFINGTVESYAPIEEWSYLQYWLSQKFMSLNPVLLREIRAIMQPDYKFIDEILRKIDKTDLTKISNQELALLLIDVVDFPMGDIYKLNVVQIEYSLNSALNLILEQYEPNYQDRNLLIAQLIAPGEFTVAQEEEIAFSKVVSEGRKVSANTPINNKKIAKLFLNHVDKFAPTHCAYGELPPSVDDYLQKYTMAYKSSEPLLTLQQARQNILEQYSESKKILKRINNKQLTVLCELMAAIGVFRDKNKAKLGTTIPRRLRILDEIARRTNEKRININYYLMSELTKLLDDGTKISQSVLRARKKDGVHFIRNEDVFDGQMILQQRTRIQKDESSTLKGICASPGKVNGIIRIINSRKDAAKMNVGDIMVAVGTDFDLIEIMNISGGIITEEGGLLSHASVVSRELKKPCLIGIPHATKKLKEGEHVILDATNGVVVRS